MDDSVVCVKLVKLEGVELWREKKAQLIFWLLSFLSRRIFFSVIFVVVVINKYCKLGKKCYQKKKNGENF